MARRRRTRPPLPPLIFPSDVAADRERSCSSKDRYPTQAHARSVALMNGMGGALLTYECRYCGEWHLTRRRDEDALP
ncbi:MAG TPA: hypothetical protein VIG51_06290 [Candidatus Baltobacteraceae bacterium]